MKYTQMLDQNMVPEWRNQYLDYKGLDAALNKAIDNKLRKSREKGVDSYFELIKFNQKFANYFSSECQAQLDKINSFHMEKLSEMKGKYNNLQDQLEQVLSSAIYKQIQPDSSPAGGRHQYHSNQAAHELGEPGGSYNTINSISDIFRNLKGRMSPTSGNCPILDHESSSNNLYINLPTTTTTVDECRKTSVGSSIFGEGSTISSLRRDSLERVSTAVRKLFQGCAQSARRLSDQVGRLSPDIQHQSSSLQSSPAKLNRRTRQRRFSVAGHLHHRTMDMNTNDTSNCSTVSSASSTSNVMELPQQLPPLNGATPQSKKKIIASYKKKIAYLKFSFRELYFNLVLFEQYTQLNYTGFEQILRKHDRMFASALGRKFYQEHVQTADFYNHLPIIDRLIEDVEHIYTLHFENGNRRKAIKKLQVPTDVYKQSSPMLDFRVGYELGMFAVLFVLVIMVGLFSDTGYDWRTVFRLYRSPLILIIFLFQAGISILIWKHYKINHVLIFELNPRDNLSAHHFLEFGSLLGIIWSISVLIFLFSGQLQILPSLCPLVVVILIFIYLLNPTATGHHRSRFWLLRILGRIFTAPFHRVTFADFWIADQLVSIVPLFLDLEYLSCFYTTGDVMSKSHLSVNFVGRCLTRNPQDLVIRTVVAALPAWFRCAQCLRRWRDENWLTMHICNAGKYWCMVSVIVLSSISQYNKSSFEFDTMRIIWIVAAVFTSCLTAYWDVKYDFGFFNTYDKDEPEEEPASRTSLQNGLVTSRGSSQHDFYYNPRTKKKSKQYPFLRKELVYPVWVYYFAIIEDWVLRFGWIITISLTEFSNIEAGLVVSLLAPLEMFRRFVWNCIRLENEQLNNCGLFRAVRDIPIEVVAPIDESHLDKVIMMMDSRDGPSMRNRLMKRRALRPEKVSFIVLEEPDELSETGTKRCDIRI